MSATFDVSGVCAVLHQPMSGTRMTLQDPSPLLWYEGTPVFHDGRPAGVVTGMQLDGNLLWWHGTLAEPPPRSWKAPATCGCPCMSRPLASSSRRGGCSEWPTTRRAGR